MNKHLNRLGRWGLVAGVLLTACGPQGGGPGGALVAGGTPGGPTPTTLPTRVITPRTTIAADGALALTRPIVTLSFEATGRVQAVHAIPGQRVKTGDVLAELEGAQLRQLLVQAKDQLNVTDAQVKLNSVPAKQTDIVSAQAALNSVYARYTEVKKGPTASDIEQALRAWNQAKNSLYQSQVSRDLVCGLDKSSNKCKEANYSTLAAEQNERAAHERYRAAQQPATPDKLAAASSDIVAAQNNLSKLQQGLSPEQKKLYEVQRAQAEMAVARAQRNLAKTQLLSPCDCVVQEVTLVVGGAAAGAVTLLDTTSLRFRTSNLTELDVVRVKAGLPVSIRLKSFDDAFTGKVQAVLPISSGTQGNTAQFTVLIALDPPPSVALRPGMTGQAEIRLIR